MQSRSKDTVKPVLCGKHTSFIFPVCSTNGYLTGLKRPSGDRALIQAVSRISYRGDPSSNPEQVHVRYEVDEVALVQALPCHYHSTDSP